MQFSRKTFILAVVFLCYSANLSLNAAPPAAKPAEIEVKEISIQRKEGRIEVDTVLKNISAKPVAGLTAVYRFYAAGHAPVTTQRTKIDESLLGPGEESNIRAQLDDQARAITVEFAATDGNGKELRVKNAGPFPIE